MKFKDVIFLVLAASTGLLLALQIRQCNPTSSKGEQIDLVNALQDTLRVFKNKDSSNTATISVLQTEKIKIFTNLKIRDTEIQKLQSIVNDYKGKLQAGNSVTNALLETLAKSQGKTTVVYKDTVITENKIVYVYPEYSDSLVNKWITYRARMNKDSSYFSLKMTHDFSVVVGRNKKRPFVDFTSYNPYDSITSLRSYQVSLPKPKKWGIGFQAGGRMTLSKSFVPKILPYVGIGVSYNFIRL